MRSSRCISRQFALFTSSFFRLSRSVPIGNSVHNILSKFSIELKENIYPVLPPKAKVSSLDQGGPLVGAPPGHRPTNGLRSMPTDRLIGNSVQHF